MYGTVIYGCSIKYTDKEQPDSITLPRWCYDFNARQYYIWCWESQFCCVDAIEPPVYCRVVSKATYYTPAYIAIGWMVCHAVTSLNTEPSKNNPTVWIPSYSMVLESLRMNFRVSVNVNPWALKYPMTLDFRMPKINTRRAVAWHENQFLIGKT